MIELMKHVSFAVFGSLSIWLKWSVALGMSLGSQVWITHELHLSVVDIRFSIFLWWPYHFYFCSKNYTCVEQCNTQFISQALEKLYVHFLPYLCEQNHFLRNIFIFFLNNIQIKCVFEGFLCLTFFFEGYFCLTFFFEGYFCLTFFFEGYFCLTFFFFEGYFCLTYFFELPLQIIFVYLRLFFVYTFEGYIVENSLFLSAGYFLPISIYRVEPQRSCRGLRPD